MAQELGCSKVQVIRKALTLLQIAIKDVKDGNKLMVLDRDGSPIKEITGVR